MVEFRLSEEQEKKVEAWKREKISSPFFNKGVTEISRFFTYEFINTGICTFVTIRGIDGDSLDLTEYDKI